MRFTYPFPFEIRPGAAGTHRQHRSLAGQGDARPAASPLLLPGLAAHRVIPPKLSLIKIYTKAGKPEVSGLVWRGLKTSRFNVFCSYTPQEKVIT